MKTLKTTLLFGLAAMAAAGCGDDEPTPSGPPTETPGQTIEVAQKLTADTRWEAKNTYVLKDHIFIESGTLTIEPGTVIKGEGRSSLVVTTGGRLMAEGTREKPIVFTSSKPEGDRNPADWGGVVMLGLAPINSTGGTNVIEGFPETQPGIRFGGTNPAHNCGTLKYARIEYAGYKLTDNNELNGLTLGGCGTGTVVDYVQVHRGADDGVEMFGGTADLKHIVITQPDDDGLDWDLGWTGRVQFLAIQQNADVGNCGFESDSNPVNPADAAPRSSPRVYNVSIIGSDRDPKTAGKTQIGMHLKNGTAGEIRNVVMAYMTDLGINVDGAPAVAQYTSGALSVRNSVFWDNGNVTTVSGMPSEGSSDQSKDANFDEPAEFMKDTWSNRVVDPLLSAARNLTGPDFKPAAGSPLLTGGATPPGDGFFDTSATFVGAVGADDWTAGWTAYPVK